MNIIYYVIMYCLIKSRIGYSIILVYIQDIFQLTDQASLFLRHTHVDAMIGAGIRAHLRTLLSIGTLFKQRGG